MAEKVPRRPTLRRLALVALRVALVVAALLALHALLGEAVREIAADVLPHDPAALRRWLVLVVALYAVLLALPFVPGVELGLAILAMLGAEAAPYVYAGTVAGLSLAFLCGRLVPLRVLVPAALALRMRRTAALLRRVEGLAPSERLELLLEGRTRALPWLVRHRHIALAVALNLPGNAFVGGGGGIALAAGMSRIFSPGAFLLTVALAVSPVPILVWALGGGPGAFRW